MNSMIKERLELAKERITEIKNESFMHQDATVTVTPIAACTAPTDSATTAAAAAETAAALINTTAPATITNPATSITYPCSLLPA